MINYEYKAALVNKIYVVGGSDASLCIKKVKRFNPILNSRQIVSSLHSRRYSRKVHNVVYSVVLSWFVFRTTHAVVQAQGYLYGIGGNDCRSSLNSLERYDSYNNNNKWALIVSLALRQRCSFWVSKLGKHHFSKI